MHRDEKYQCCFCGNEIEAKPPDIGVIDFATEFQLPPDERRMQTFFCHTECFAQRLKPPAMLYVLDL